MTVSFKGAWQMAQSHGVEDDFLNECNSICEREEKFKSFKRNPIFIRVIGNDVRKKEVSDVFYNHIKDTSLVDNIVLYKSNDAIGQPVLYSYPKAGLISPGTLCFLSILHDINTRLVDLEGKTVCEIGSGYGGQAKIFLDYGAKTMDLIDRKQTLLLAKKYLDHFKYDNIFYHTTESIEPKEYDVVISNWCLSELDSDGVDFYVDKIISKSEYAYFLVNFRHLGKKQHLLDKLREHFSMVTVEEENPPTSKSENNVIFCRK